MNVNFEAIEKAYNMGVSEQEAVLEKIRAEIVNLDNLNLVHIVISTVHLNDTIYALLSDFHQ